MNTGAARGSFLYVPTCTVERVSVLCLFFLDSIEGMQVSARTTPMFFSEEVPSTQRVTRTSDLLLVSDAHNVSAAPKCPCALTKYTVRPATTASLFEYRTVRQVNLSLRCCDVLSHRYKLNVLLRQRLSTKKASLMDDLSLLIVDCSFLVWLTSVARKAVTVLRADVLLFSGIALGARCEGHIVCCYRNFLAK